MPSDLRPFGAEDRDRRQPRVSLRFTRGYIPAPLPGRKIDPTRPGHEHPHHHQLADAHKFVALNLNDYF